MEVHETGVHTWLGWIPISSLISPTADTHTHCISGANILGTLSPALASLGSGCSIWPIFHVAPSLPPSGLLTKVLGAHTNTHLLAQVGAHGEKDQQELSPLLCVPSGDAPGTEAQTDIPRGSGCRLLFTKTRWVAWHKRNRILDSGSSLPSTWTS